MENYIVVFMASLTPHVVISMFGTLIGAFVNSDIKRYGIKLTFLMIVLACSASAAITEYMIGEFGDMSIFVYLLLGGFIGMFGLSLLDAMRLAMPGFTKRLVNGITETIVTSVIDIIVTIFETIKLQITKFRK